MKRVALLLACIMIFSVTAAASDIFAPLGLGIFRLPTGAVDELESIAVKLLKEKPEEEEIIPRGHFAYVVSATQKLNMESERYYATLTLINETGLFTVDTVEDVENYNFFPVLEDGRIGKIASLEGKFVQFDMRDTAKIQKLEPRRSAVQTSFSEKDGFYLVNIVDERGKIISFYDTAEDTTVGVNEIKSASYHSDGHAIISIDGDTYEGAFLRKISSKTEKLPAGLGNAVIQMSEGEVVRVFSFDEYAAPPLGNE